MHIEAPSFATDEELIQFSGRGEIYSYTTVYQAPTEFEEFAPYKVALIRLEEGPLVTAQLTDLDYHSETEIIDGEERQVNKYHVEIGMKVEMVTRLLKKDGDRGMLVYGYKFRPLLQDSSSAET